MSVVYSSITLYHSVVVSNCFKLDAARHVLGHTICLLPLHCSCISTHEPSTNLNPRTSSYQSTLNGSFTHFSPLPFRRLWAWSITNTFSGSYRPILSRCSSRSGSYIHNCLPSRPPLVYKQLRISCHDIDQSNNNVKSHSRKSQSVWTTITLMQWRVILVSTCKSLRASWSSWSRERKGQASVDPGHIGDTFYISPGQIAVVDRIDTRY